MNELNKYYDSILKNLEDFSNDVENSMDEDSKLKLHDKIIT